jgi:hypothetical protein
MRINYTHHTRLKKRTSLANKGASSFTNFWKTLEFTYHYCFVCGKHIPKLNLPFALRPFGKKGDYVHDFCFNAFITFEDANPKLNDNSRLICHFEDGISTELQHHVCRERVLNQMVPLTLHIINYHNHLNNNSFEFLRSTFFLKPTGKRFGKIAEK